MLVGAWLFGAFFANSSLRLVFTILQLLNVFASSFDYVLAVHWWIAVPSPHTLPVAHAHTCARTQTYTRASVHNTHELAWRQASSLPQQRG